MYKAPGRSTSRSDGCSRRSEVRRHRIGVSLPAAVRGCIDEPLAHLPLLRRSTRPRTRLGVCRLEPRIPPRCLAGGTLAGRAGLGRPGPDIAAALDEGDAEPSGEM